MVYVEGRHKNVSDMYIWADNVALSDVYLTTYSRIQCCQKRRQYSCALLRRHNVLLCMHALFKITFFLLLNAILPYLYPTVTAHNIENIKYL